MFSLLSLFWKKQNIKGKIGIIILIFFIGIITYLATENAYLKYKNSRKIKKELVQEKKQKQKIKQKQIKVITRGKTVTREIVKKSNQIDKKLKQDENNNNNNNITDLELQKYITDNQE